jgi:hypothetical protein
MVVQKPSQKTLSGPPQSTYADRLTLTPPYYLFTSLSLFGGLRGTGMWSEGGLRGFLERVFLRVHMSKRI